MNREFLLPIAGANVSVTVTADPSVIGAFISAVRASASSKTVVGLDVEWDSTDPNGKPALLQLCSGTRCLIIQLLFLGGTIPHAVKDFLADPSIIFVGVGIISDVAKLKIHYAIRCCSAMDLDCIAALALGAGLDGLGLVNLANRVLGLSIEKSPHVARSNWAGSVLVTEQIVYAATDAYVGYLVGSKLLSGH